MFKKLIATIATTICCLADPLPVMAQNTYDDHTELWSTIRDLGIATLINNKIQCRNPNKAGSYYTNGLLVICQDNREENNGIQVEWTDNDLDTLRHEAHHIVQDCASGKIADDKVTTVFTEDKLMSFLEGSSYSDDQLLVLYKTLKEQLSPQDILLELEAYAVAKDITARDIKNKLIEFCTD